VELNCRAFTAYALWLLGYPDQAKQWSHDALVLAQEVASPIKLASVLGITARLHLQCRDISGVSTRADALIRLATEQEFAYWLAQGMLLQGWALAVQGQAAGLAQMQQGLAACQATGADVSRPYYLACLAEAYGMSGQSANAHAVLSDALIVAQAQGQPLDLARLYWLQGTLLAQESQAHNAQAHPHTFEAEVSLHQTLAIARQHHAQAWALRAAVALSRLWQSQDKRNKARRLLLEVYSWFTEGFDTADLREAKTLLDELSGYRCSERDS
jgi:predicted ATPase